MVVIPSQRRSTALDKDHVAGVLLCVFMGIIGAYQLGQASNTFSATVLFVATIAYGVGLVYNMSWLMTKYQEETIKVARRD